MQKKIRIVFDVNIWISFTIGKQLDSLRHILLDKKFEIYISTELIAEYMSVIEKPKLKKYLAKDRIIETLNLLESMTKNVVIKSSITVSRDIKDDYLLALSQDYKIKYLVTGDKDLLVLKEHKKTQILTMSEFLEIVS